MDAHGFSPGLSGRFWSVLAVTFLAAFMAHAAPALAQEANPEVLNKVTKLNKKALDAYQKRDYETARSVLKEALELCSSSGLDKHPIKARTHIHLGVVLIGGFKQHDAGIKHFRKALQIQPDIQLTKSLVTPAMQDAFEEATAAGGGAGADATGGGDQSDNDQGTAPGGEAGEGDEASAPRRKVAAKKKKRKHDEDGDEDEGGVAKKHGDDDDDDDDVGANNTGKIFVGLTLGGGFGIASGTAEMASTIKHTLASAGLAPAQLLHIAPEVGYFFKSDILLSVQARYQIVTGVNPGPMTCGTTACSAHKSDIDVFAKATYFQLPGGDFHAYVGGSVGGGAIRHVSNFPGDTSCGPSRNQTCVDTLQAGPFLIGPNVGIIYDLGKTASLILAVNTEVGVPKFTFNIDANVGVGLKF